MALEGDFIKFENYLKKKRFHLKFMLKAMKVFIRKNIKITLLAVFSQARLCR